MTEPNADERPLTGWAARLTADRVAGALLLGLGAFALQQSLRLPLGSLGNPGPAYAPALLAGALVLVGAVVLLTGGGSRPILAIGWSELPHALLVLGGAVFAALALERLGYRITMVALLAFYLGVVERRHPLMVLAVSLGLGLGSWYLFYDVLRVPLPLGRFGV